MLEELIDNKFLDKDDRVAVGVSGGADSMLLLWSLIFKQKEIGFYLKVINVNHHIRGEESDRDSKFVADFCKSKNIDCVVLDIDVLKNKNIEKKTLEQMARDLRFDAIKREMKKDKLNKLFLAHHKNDQAETILMHILRGSGISGAVGMKDVVENIYRPLINLSKQDINKYIKEYGIKYVEDSSNVDNNMTRNYMRNVVIPQIEKVYPKAINTLSEFGKKCAEIQDYIESMLNDDLLEKGKDFCLIKESVFDFPNFLIREYLKRAFAFVGVFSDIESKHYELICKLQKNKVNSYLDLPHNIQARKTYSGIYLMKKTNKKTEICEYDFVVGEIQFKNIGKIKTEIVDADKVVYQKGVLFVDYDKISTNAVWRQRKIGDMFAKFGTGTKKLNDYFTDKKIDVEKRDDVPILVTQNQVLVVLDYDISENVKIDANTDTVIKITFEKDSIS